jgi:hypothetical protein
LWNAFTNADSNGYCNCYRDGHSYGDRNGHTDRNFNSHANSYRYGKTHSKPETPSHTKATSDPSASSVTGNRCQSFKAGRRIRWNALSQRVGWSGIGFGRRRSTFLLSQLNLQNRFQGKIWIEMIGSQPVAIEER